MVAIHNQEILLIGFELNFRCSLTVEPIDVSSFVFVFVELLKLSNYGQYRFGSTTFVRRICNRPTSSSEHIHTQFQCTYLCYLFSVILSEFLAVIDILEHGFNLIHTSLSSFSLRKWIIDTYFKIVFNSITLNFAIKDFSASLFLEVALRRRLEKYFW